MSAFSTISFRDNPMIHKHLPKWRQEYTKVQALTEHNIATNPLQQFTVWLADAATSELYEPNAMMLSTVNENGQPSARVVLLKGIDRRGFLFYTNYNSQKAKEIEKNPKASMVFWWDRLARQIRIQGDIEKVSATESDHYFSGRERGSNLGAWASEQSSTLESRRVLQKKYEEVSQRFQGKNVPRPSCWGGYCLIPHKIEFWQGRENRLHDRLLYTLAGDDKWIITRLSP